MKKVLHITYHEGCYKEWRGIAARIGLDIHEMAPDWGYNISQEVADSVWNKHKDYFNSFDIILITDTPPLVRIFLREEFTKPLVAWVTIMIDYSDEATNNTLFPHDGYKDLVNAKTNNINYIFWDECQLDYALNKGYNIGANIIPSIGVGVDTLDTNVDILRYAGKFYIPSYSNETENINLKAICDSLNIPAVVDRFNSSIELQYSNGIICLPYTVRTISFMENIRLGIPYFIPSNKFLLELVTAYKCWFQGGGEALKYSSWHNTKIPGRAINYFDSWDDLKKQTSIPVTQDEKDISMKWAIEYANNIINKWKQLFDNL